MDSFDRTTFEAFKSENRLNDYDFWLLKSEKERLEVAYHLNSVAFNFDPEYPPRMDKTVFEARKRN